MQKTKNRQTNEFLTVDIERLAAMLSCGHATAKKLGKMREQGL